MLSDEVRFSIARRLRGASLTALSVGLLSSLLLVTSTATATGTQKVSLEDLVNGGGDLVSSSGNLRFSNFSVEITGDTGDLSGYQLEGRFNAFTIYGRNTGVQPESLNIHLSYDVEAVRLNNVMTAVGLSSYKWNKFGGNEAFIAVLNDAAEVIASGTRIEDETKFDLELYDFSQLVTIASINEEITIDRSINNKSWRLKRTFDVLNDHVTTQVPEPNTALMLGLGMVGVASYARRRR